MIRSSNAPVTGSKFFHIDCHDDVANEVVLGQTAFDAAHQSKVFHLCTENHDSDMPLGQTACDATQQDDHQDVHEVRIEKLCIGAVTEEDMLRK